MITLVTLLTAPFVLRLHEAGISTLTRAQCIECIKIIASKPSVHDWKIELCQQIV